MDFDIQAWVDENQPKWPSKWTPGHVQEPPRNQRRIQGQRTVSDRARDYLAKVDGAIQGDKGSGKALYVACILVNGFDLTIDQARPLFEEWNHKCQPKWTPAEIDHKLGEAAGKDEDKPRGYLLDKRPDRPRRPVRPVACGEPPTAEAAQREGRACDANGDGNEEILDNPPDDGIDYDDERVEIEVVPYNEYVVNLETMAAISEDSRIFQRAGVLVEDIRVKTEQNKRIKNNIGSCEIVPISLPKVRHFISQCVKFYKNVPFKDEDDEIDYKKVYMHVPDWCSKTVHRWGGYPGFRPLEGITEVPILHMDGTIFETPGYDPETRMIYEPSGDFPAISESPSQEDARRAADRLLDLVCDFPWEEIDKDGGMVHKSSWLAGLLTVLCRHLVDGCCPGFLFTANIAGTGKSTLIDIISMIATGRKMPRTVYKTNDEEMKKSIMSILMSAKQFILFDNIENGSMFGGGVIDPLLTSRVYSDRPLATNSMPDLIVNTVFFATGNQINLKGDSLRRFIISKIRSYLESPELRSDFKIKEEILSYVSNNRDGFVTDALTIVRAYIRAGMPSGGLVSMGSYHEWSKIIREAVYWTIGHDPGKSQHHLKKEDQASLARATLLDGWDELIQSYHEKLLSINGKSSVKENGITILKAIEILNGNPEEYKKLRNSLIGISRSAKNEFPPNSVIGKFLGTIHNVVIGGKYLHKIENTPEGTKWTIRQPEVKMEPEEDEPENVEVAGVPF